MGARRTVLVFATIALVGGGVVSQDLFTALGDNGEHHLVVAGDGKVGVNTEFPFAFLEVRQPGSGTSRLMNVVSTGDQSQMVNLERTTPFGFGGNDLIQLVLPDSNNGGQFIEAEIPGNVRFRVDADGNVRADGTFSGGGADFAELMRITSGRSSATPGDVLVIDPTQLRSVVPSTAARSTLVAGIYSTRPGFLGSEHDLDLVARGLAPDQGREGNPMSALEVGRALGEVPVAVVGIVPVKVSAENGAIIPGDLLVTSSIPGHAMRDGEPRLGTILGKSLGYLEEGTGTIQVLVTLQ